MKNKVRKTLLIIGGICTTIAVCLFFGFFGGDDGLLVNQIVGIVAIVSGLGSLLVGVSSIFSTSLDNVREYFATGDTPEMSNSRFVLYNYRYIKIKYGKTIYDKDFDEWASTISQTDPAILPTNKAKICEAADIQLNFFQMWGLLQSKGFLPMWVFETASGYSILKLGEATMDIIKEHARTNPFYAGQFVELCKRIAKANKKAIKLCRENEEKYILKTFGVSNPWEGKDFIIE